MSKPVDIRVDESVHQMDNKVVEIGYVYHETQNDETQTYRVTVKRQDYERVVAQRNKPSLPFDSFIKVLRPFMMGTRATADIPEAFRLLDTDNSGTIDLAELAAFMPAIVPNADPHTLLRYIQKTDENSDYKLNLQEFTDLINQGVGRDITVGRA